MLVSAHTHAESYLTGSTVANLITRAKDLKRSHFTYSDHGHLSSCLKAYELSKKAGLKFIPGIELYFKDSTCPVVSGSEADRCKYFTVTVYAESQEAYQAICNLVSKTDRPTIEIYEETQQLYSWADLEALSRLQTNIVLGGVHCIVGKVLLAGKADLAESVFLKLNTLFKGRVFLSLLCEPWIKKWNSVIEIKHGLTSTSCLSGDYISTDRTRRIKASDLLERGGHGFLKSVYTNSTYKEVNLPIDSVVSHKGFLPLPGGDVTLRVNKFFKQLSEKYNIPLLVTDYAYYANKEDKIVQTMKLEGRDKLHSNLNMKSGEEIKEYLIAKMGLPSQESDLIVRNNEIWAKRFDAFSFKYEWRLADSGPDPLKQVLEIIKKNGRMKWDDPIWTARLREEISVIAKNPKKDLTAYFLPIRDVLNFYLENNKLTGPGRGSAGGSLLCYLLGITQINPFEYDLPFQRFFSLDRIMTNKLPDIDVDLEDRTLLVGEDGQSGYLYGRWGDKAAQTSTRTTVRLKSAIKDTNRYLKGKVEPEIDVLTKGLPAPPQGITDGQFVFGYEDTDGGHINGLIEESDDLKRYIKTRPEEWDIVSKAMGLTRAFSRHASAFVLSDVPIKDVVPVKNGYITQYEAKQCESAGLIKYDFLVINQLADIRVCMDLIKQKNNRKDLPVTHFPHNGFDFFIWDIPKDPDVFKSVWNGNTETCFQINTKSMVPYVKDILPQSIMDLATILALVRPGPLDFVDSVTGRNMVDEYVLRRNGQSQADIKELADILPETYGIITYQEQLNKIARDIAGFPGPEAELLRENMAKKKMAELMKMKPAFIEGAKKKVSEDIAEKIWEQMVTFGRYGFSVIHAVEYAHVTYACMFLKHHYPLEWWAAILTNATEQEITGKFWPYVKDIVSPPDINLSGDTMVVDYREGKIRSKLGIIRGLGEATIEPLVANRPYKDIQDFVNKGVAGNSLAHKLIHVGVLDSLFPARSSLIEKIKLYEDSVENKKFAQKINDSKKTGKRVRSSTPKEGKVPEQYLNLHPLTDAAMKKSILPSMPINIHDLGKKYSKILSPFEQIPHVISNRGHKTRLIDGERLRLLDEKEGLEKDIYIASTCFVLEAKEFSFSKGSKKALKLILDADGYVSEKVLWPEYNTGQLVYPQELKKGSIATVFFRKKGGKKDMNITGIHIET